MTPYYIIGEGNSVDETDKRCIKERVNIKRNVHPL